MKPALTLFLLTAASPALAAPGGPISQLNPGSYQCEQPGDAGGATGLRVPAEDFEIINANTYRNGEGRGTYLLTGDVLALTSGPKAGETYHRVTNGFLRKIAGGQDTKLRCVRRLLTIR